MLLVTDIPVNGCTVLVPRRCFEQVGLFDERLKVTQDYDLWFRMARKYPFVHVPEVLLRSRMHAAQGTRRMASTCLAEGNANFTQWLDEIALDQMPSPDPALTRFFFRAAVRLKRRGYIPAAEHALLLYRRYAVAEFPTKALKGVLAERYFAVCDRLWANVCPPDGTRLDRSGESGGEGPKTAPWRGVRSGVRILQLVHSLDRGGAERVALEFDRGAKALGHQMCVAMLLDSNAFTEPQYASVETRFLVSREQYHWPRYVLPASEHLREIFAEWKPDVLFTHTPDIAIVAAWAQPKVPAVEVIHWYWDTSAGSAMREAWRRGVSRWAFSRIGRRGILVAPHLLENSSRYLGFPESRFRCVENGVDLERFAFVPREGTGAPRIAIVGALNALKRPDLGLRAFTHLRKELPGARLVLAGDGPMRHNLETLCRELCLENSVDFLGYRTDLPEVLAECHVCWHVSRREGFGLAVAEAMANGLPVVGMDVPGVRDLLGEGNAGLLVPEGDPVALADSTIRLLRDNTLFRRIARAGRSLAEDRFNVRRMVAGYLEVASEMVTGRW